MNANYMYSLIAVIVLLLLAYVGVAGLHLEVLFGIVFPYAAMAIFIAGFVYKLVDWAKSPVPFPITTTAGQQVSLPMVSANRIDNPNNKAGVVTRLLLDVFLFRSLFRNTRFEIRDGNKFSYELEKWLWLSALAFHYAFLVVVVRHFRFFTEPVLLPVQWLEKLDGFFQVGLPGIFLSGIVLMAAAIYLFLRRVWIPQMKYISLSSDYFPLFLIMAIGASGILMRYVSKVDIVKAKELTMGLVTLRPTIPEGIGPIFFIHLFLVSVLLAYFPFSKLMHVGGIFFSPTRNLQGNTREFRHENPWNYPVKIHTYEAYEEEFREKMIEAGLPVEKTMGPKKNLEEGEKE
jgi:nitrate reductase gamma subunit